MPLEHHCVRFIDNFSGGTRGALSAENFLEVSILCMEATMRWQSVLGLSPVPLLTLSADPDRALKQCCIALVNAPDVRTISEKVKDAILFKAIKLSVESAILVTAGRVRSDLPAQAALDSALHKGPPQRPDPGLPHKRP